jgi:AcrR family transcriptional regulator
VGLRERKKQQTRETIIEVALRLFDERGFEQTTVADIADAANIAPRTFFGYFAAKEDVVFHDFDAVHARFSERLDGRADGESMIDALRAIIAEVIAETDFEDPAERLRHHLIATTPVLRERDRALLGRFEATLAEAVARDFAVPADTVRPRMVAAAATAALSALQTHYEDPDGLGKDAIFTSTADPLAIVDELLVFLRGGIAALAEQPGPPPPPRRGPRPA